MDTSQSGTKTQTTTQSGSIQSEDQHPPTPVVVALGTPVIPNDEEASELTAPQSPPFIVPHNLGFEDAPMGKKREHSLMKVQGDPAPLPMGHGNNYAPGTQQGPTEDQALDSLQEETKSPAPTSCTSKFFGKLTPTQWGLVIAFLLILGLVILVAVVLVGGGQGGGGTAEKVSDPAEDVSPPTPATPRTRSPSRAPISSPDPSPAPSQKPVQDPRTSPPTPSPTTLVPTLEPSTNQPSALVGSETLETILTRGFLVCGITPGLDGFSTLNGDTYEGFEADLCRAIAAAVFGSADNLQFSPLEEGEAFIALQLGGVDVLASHLIHTMERDVYEPSAKAGFTFSVPYLYDGLTFGGVPPFGACADNLNSTANCTALSICTVDGSSYSNLVAELIPNARPLLLPSIEAVYGTFDEGFCNAIAGARFEVSEEAVRNNGYTGSYEVGTNLYSREPLSLVTRDTDARWSDMVQWVLQALFAAEEQGVSMDTTQSFMTTELFGDSFTNLFRNAIAAVGNYGDIYARHLESIVPRTNINMINTGDSALILSLPFGNLETSGPGPIESGTLQRILDRGHLRCGITRAPGFAEFDATTGVWSGLDVDFCRAVSAAIFNGVADDVNFRVLPGTERFVALANDDVDLLSRISTWNLERDVMEADAGTGFSFSQPDFYDGLAVGGIPPFGRCADILDTTSEFCQDLKICVASGTTTIDVFRSRFAERFIVPRLTHDEVVAGLNTGDCNVIAGGSQEVVESSVRDNGYTGPYEVGQNRFLKDPLAVVTRQDDPQFTSFVNWIVSATFYAEEEGITQSTAGQMPFVFLFGPLYGRMLIDAIQAVGNYAEIYARNLQSIIPRGGQNGANVNPFGPQHYPLI